MVSQTHIGAERTGRAAVWALVMRLYRQRRVRTAITLGLVMLGPTLAVLTFLGFGSFDLGANSPSLRLILLADLIYILVVAALVLLQVGRLVAARRAKSAGSRLHLICPMKPLKLL